MTLPSLFRKKYVQRVLSDPLLRSFFLFLGYRFGRMFLNSPCKVERKKDKFKLCNLIQYIIKFLWFFFFFFGCAVWLAGSQFPIQGLNWIPGHSNERLESSSLCHQGTPNNNALFGGSRVRGLCFAACGILVPWPVIKLALCRESMEF